LFRPVVPEPPERVEQPELRQPLPLQPLPKFTLLQPLLHPDILHPDIDIQFPPYSIKSKTAPRCVAPKAAVPKYSTINKSIAL